MKKLLTEGKTLGAMCPKIPTGKPKRPIGPPPAPKPKIEIPPKHKQFMDQVVETYHESLKKFFSNSENRGPKYDPAKLPGHVAELSIATTSLTLDDEWNPEYESYIIEQSKK